jgi:hypothetical protein
MLKMCLVAFVAFGVPAASFAEKLLIPAIEYTVQDQDGRVVIGANGGLFLLLDQNNCKKTVKVPATYNPATGKYHIPETSLDVGECKKATDRTVGFESSFILRTNKNGDHQYWSGGTSFWGMIKLADFSATLQRAGNQATKVELRNRDKVEGVVISGYKANPGSDDMPSYVLETADGQQVLLEVLVPHVAILDSFRNKRKIRLFGDLTTYTDEQDRELPMLSNIRVVDFQ